MSISRAALEIIRCAFRPHKNNMGMFIKLPIDGAPRLLAISTYSKSNKEFTERQNSPGDEVLIASCTQAESDDNDPVSSNRGRENGGTTTEAFFPEALLSDSPSLVTGMQYKQERFRLEEVNQELQDRLSQAEDQIATLLGYLQEQNREKLQLQNSVQRKQSLLQESTELHFTQVTELERQLEAEKALASYELKKTEQRVTEVKKDAQKHQKEAAELSNSVIQLQTDLNKCRTELGKRENELLQSQMLNGAQASQISQLELQLQETQDQLEKKTELVTELEEKVLRCESKLRNVAHRKQLLESQTKAVRGELMDAVERLQVQQEMLLCSQQKVEEQKAAMKKLTAEFRLTLGQLDQMRRDVEARDQALKETEDNLQQTAHKLSHLELAFQEYRIEMEQKLASLHGVLEDSERNVAAHTKQVNYLTERQERLQVQLKEKEKAEQEMRHSCKNLTQKLEESMWYSGEKESDVRRLQEEMEKLQKKSQEEESRLRSAIAMLSQQLHSLRKQHQEELNGVQKHHADEVNSLRLSQLHLSEDLQQCIGQMEQANTKSAVLQTGLHKCMQLLQKTGGSVLLKESEIKSLTTALSDIERSRDLRNVTHGSELSTTYLSNSQSNLKSNQATPLSLPDQAGLELTYRLRSTLAGSEEAIPGPADISENSLNL